MKTRYIKPLAEVTKVKLRGGLCQTVSGQVTGSYDKFDEDAKQQLGNNESEGSWGNLWEE